MDERPISRAGVPGLAQNPMWNEAGMWLGINGLTSSAPIADWSVLEHLYGAPVPRGRTVAARTPKSKKMKGVGALLAAPRGWRMNVVGALLAAPKGEEGCG